MTFVTWIASFAQVKSVVLKLNSSTKKNIENNQTNNSIEESIIKKINKKKIKEIDLEKPKAIEEKKETNKKKGFFQRLKTKFNNLNH